MATVPSKKFVPIYLQEDQLHRWWDSERQGIQTEARGASGCKEKAENSHTLEWVFQRAFVVSIAEDFHDPTGQSSEQANLT